MERCCLFGVLFWNNTYINAICWVCACACAWAQMTLMGKGVPWLGHSIMDTRTHTDNTSHTSTTINKDRKHGEKEKDTKILVWGVGHRKRVTQVPCQSGCSSQEGLHTCNDWIRLVPNQQVPTQDSLNGINNPQYKGWILAGNSTKSEK